MKAVDCLEGNWRPELVFVLQQELDMYDTYQKRIGECDHFMRPSGHRPDANFAENVKQLIVVDFKPDSREP